MTEDYENTFTVNFHQVSVITCWVDKIVLNGAQTFGKGIWIVAVVFEPEAVSELEVAKLSGYKTSERGSKKCSIGRDLGDTSWPQVYIIDVAAHKMNIASMIWKEVKSYNIQLIPDT